MKYSINNKVRFSETGDNEVLSFGGIIDYFQDCCNCQSESIGAGVEYQLKRNRVWILNSWNIEFDERIHLDDQIITTTWPYEFKGACGKRNFTVAREGMEEKFIIRGDSTWALFDMESGRLARIEDKDINMYSLSDKLNMEYTKKKIEKSMNYKQENSFIVRRYQLDTNKHMNNSWYVKIAEEFLKENEKIISLRVEYKKSAKYNDVIIPFTAECEKRILVELRSESGDIYAIVEFGK